MKAASIIAAAAVFVASLVSATPQPNRVEARATSTSATTLPTVTTTGNAFFAGSDRFYIRGVDYQPGGSSDITDPLANATVCERDIPYFKELGINTVRVYTVDNSVNHDACMNALAAAGIYAAIDVNTPYFSLNRADVAASYNADYLQSVFATVDAFAGYSNTLLFFSGNEVINSANTTNCAPYVKAVTRDIKQYRDARGYRAIPVGYSAADVDSNYYLMAEYMNCGNTVQRSDFYAFNDYSWCDPSSYTTSGWSQKVALFSNYSIPIFLSEFGCNTNTRTFEEISALYNPEMTGVYSGGLVYEYSQEGNDYGLVTISGSTVTTDTDFTNLKNEYAATADPSNGGGYTTNNTESTCPTTSDDWQVTAFLGDNLPALPAGALKYMNSGAGTGPGLTEDGSQDAGGASTGTQTGLASSVTSTSRASTATGSSSTTKSSSSSTAKSAATLNMNTEFSYAPFVVTAVVALSSLLGASLL